MVTQHSPIDKKTIAIIGLGLIGSSLLQALFEQDFAKFVACDLDKSTLEKAKSQGLVVKATDQITEALKGVDGVVIATPARTVRAIFVAISSAICQGELREDVLITDTISTKGNVVQEALAVFGQLPPCFVPAHPIAGAEKSGFDSRNPKLFKNHQVIICPHDKVNQNALEYVCALWRTLGADLIMMDTKRHDQVLSYTSHLPHLLAYALTHRLACHSDNLEMFRYAAGGFRDFSRIAGSDPVMWRDIFFANKTAVLAALTCYEDELKALRSLIENNDETLLAYLGKAQKARSHFGHMLTKAKPNQGEIMQRFIISPSDTITGTVRVASDKSISHRAIMLASLADGVSHIQHFLAGEDALSTLNAFCQMGVPIHRTGDSVTVHGVGMQGLSAPAKPLDMGNSGTSMRLLAGILSAQPFDSVLVGDESLSKRPMGRVAVPLSLMGASIQTTAAEGTPPLSICGNPHLVGIDYTLPVASAQVKSCLLLAGLFAKGQTRITEPQTSRDHSERMLKAFGYPIKKAGNVITLTGGGRLGACDVSIPADISSAMFFVVLALIAKQGEVVLSEVGVNPTRTGALDILRLMGADIDLRNERLMGGEPVADIYVRSSSLHGIDIPPHLVPLAIDEFPVLFIAASCAVGQTRLTNAKELRVKESDRIAVMAEGLQTLGVSAVALDDGIIIDGKGDNDRVFTGGVIDSHHDHRIAMSFSVAAVRALDTITITNTQTVQTSFPSFAMLAKQVGLALSVVS